MKLTASKTSTAGEMMLSEVNPYEKWVQSVVRNIINHNWEDFEANKFSMLTDDPLQEGQEVDREEYEVVEQYYSYDAPEWQDTDNKDIYHTTRQILRRKAVVLTDKISHINCDPEALKNPAFVNAMNKMAELAYNKSVAEPINVSQNDLLFEVAEIASEKMYYNRIGFPIPGETSIIGSRAYKDKKLFDESKDKWQFDSLGFIRELKDKGYSISNSKAVAETEMTMDEKMVKAMEQFDKRINAEQIAERITEFGADNIEEKVKALANSGRAVAEKQAGEWVSVEERLPNENEWVLVAKDSGVMTMGAIRIGGCNGFYLYGDSCPDHDVTHWMPLPEPPKVSK